MATLVNLIRRIVRRLPLTSEPAIVVGSSDPTVKQLLEMMQEEGDELKSRHDWSALNSTWTITISADPHTEAYPDDFDRLKKKASFWRSDNDLWPLIGPVSDDTWYLATQINTAEPGYWRRRGTGVQILGVTAAVTVTTEYQSKEWITGTSDTLEEWAADTDTPRLPDILFIHGVRWRWKQSKGLDYGEDMETYERELARLISNDTAAGTIRTSPPEDMDARRYSWPGVVTE